MEIALAMKFRTTLILLALVAGLGCFFLFHTARQPTDRDYREQQKRIFPAQEFEDPASPTGGGLSDRVSRIELRQGERTIVLARDKIGDMNQQRPARGAAAADAARALTSRDGRWTIEHPICTAADSGEVSSILSALEFMEATAAVRDEPGKPLDAEAYGLARPVRSITFAVGDKSWTLDIGEMTADGKRVYVARPDAPEPVVYVVRRDITDKASKDTNDLRDKAAIRFKKAAVTRIRLKPAQQSATECRKEASGWQLKRPVVDLADAASVGKLLDAIANLRVARNDFVTEDTGDAAAFGLGQPSSKIVISEDRADQTLLIGADAKDREGKVYAKRASDASVFALRKSDLAALRKWAAELRSRQALSFEPDEVIAIDVGVHGKRIRLDRDDEAWQMKEPSGFVPDNAQVEAFLDDMLGIAVQKWIDEPDAERVVEAGLSPPHATITLTVKDDASPRELRFGNRVPASLLCHARRGDNGPIFVIPEDFLTRLSAGHLAFLSRKVLEFKRGDAVALRLERPDGAFEAERRDDRWIMLEPEGAKADSAAMNEILWSLCYLEADRLVAENPDSLKEYGLDAPRITVVVSLDSDPRRQEVLLVGKECEDGTSYAMTRGGSRVFRVAKATVDALTARLTAGHEKTEETP